VPVVIWSPSLDDPYTRNVYLYVSSKGDYISLTKYYRSYAIQKGYFKSLKEKIKEVPQLKTLIGGAKVRIVHLTSISKDTLLELPKYVPKGVLTFYAFDPLSLMNSGTPQKSVATILLNNSTLQELEKQYPGFFNNYTFALWTTFGHQFVDENGEQIPHIKDLEFYPWFVENSTLCRNQKGNFIITQKDIHLVLNGTSIFMAELHPSSFLKEIQDYVSRMRKIFDDKFRAVNIDLLGKPLYQCWNPNNRSSRMDNKKERMSTLKWLRQQKYLILGENIPEWMIPYVDSSYGILGTYGERNMMEYLFALNLSKFAKVNKNYEAWFMNPARRVPLFELVYHDALVSTFHDGDGHNFYYASEKSAPDYNLTEKYWRMKDLLAILYGQAPTFHIVDDNIFAQQKERIKETCEQVCRWHEKIGFDEMTDHRFLTGDGLVQQTVFSSGWSVIVNFGNSTYTTESGIVIPPKSYYTFKINE
jgi:hypothetical protein